MRVRLRTSIGSRDGESLGVEFRQCTTGTELDVSDELAKRLIDGRFAVAVEDTPPRPVNLKGVPKKQPDIQADDSSKSVEPEAVPKGEKKPSA